MLGTSCFPAGLGGHCPLVLLTWALRFLQVGIVPAPLQYGVLSTQGCDQCPSWVQSLLLEDLGWCFPSVSLHEE